MRVILHQALLAAHADGDVQLALLELFSSCKDERRHVLLTSPPYDDADIESPLATWLTTLPGAVERRCRDILKRGLIANRSQPDGVAKIHVVASNENWEQARFSAQDAVRLVQEPFRLLLENRWSDLGFLLRLAPPTQRREVRDAAERGWIDVLGGGLGEMKKLLENLVTAPPDDIAARVYRLRLWVMFDRDADVQDRSRASQQSDEIRALCEDEALNKPWPLGFHQLGRRTIENYLPIEILREWQERESTRRTRRRLLVDALAALGKHDPKARWQYNMKKGLMGDLPGSTRDEIRNQGRDIENHELDPLFQGLPTEVRRALMNGFGGRIGELFQEERLWSQPGREEHFEREYARGPDGRREAVMATLFDRM